jgi:hypothetical protein
MSTSRSFDALRRANPRNHPGFAGAVESAAADVRSRTASAATSDSRRVHRLRPRRRLVGVAAVGAVTAVAAVAAFLTVGSSGTGVQSAAAAIKQAATVTAASAEQSGTVTVDMTHDGQAWAHKVIRWNGSDVEIRDDSPGRSGRLAQWMVVVNGKVYGPTEDGAWVEFGSPTSIDPDSGTTPGEYLDTVRQDLDGATLRRVIGAMTANGLSRSDAPDGSTVYVGKVAAAEVARETGFKESQPIRVFPFGYVAHDAAADPASLLDTTVTVDSGGLIRELAVTWGTWTYTVTYSGLGSTAAPVAPENAKTLRELRHLPAGP